MNFKGHFIVDDLGIIFSVIIVDTPFCRVDFIKWSVSEAGVQFVIRNTKYVRVSDSLIENENLMKFDTVINVARQELEEKENFLRMVTWKYEFRMQMFGQQTDSSKLYSVARHKLKYAFLFSYPI